MWWRPRGCPARRGGGIRAGVHAPRGVFDATLAFKGGTALRKFVFGASGRFSVDLDFALRSDDTNDADAVLDLLEGAELYGVRIDLDRRKGNNAQLRMMTPLGPVVEPAAISIRPHQPWLPVQVLPPQSFEYLDRGLAHEFARAPLPILDLREIAAEKIAAFWRRAGARDLYDLEHLGRIMQAAFDGPAIAALAALKIYFNVVDESLGTPPGSLSDVFGRRPTVVRGADDLGRLHASVPDVGHLLTQCAQRYAALAGLEGDLAQLAMTCNPRNRWEAQQARDDLVARLTHTRPS